jgi:hypothetical protein
MNSSKALIAAAMLAAMLCLPLPAAAHCDSLNGPVVKDARLALQSGNVSPVLKWVRSQDEAPVRAAFAKTLAVRKGSADARELADFYFFETLVRIHRAGEGATFTGVKTAEEAKVPACIVGADKALETGSIDALARQMSQEVAENIRIRFQKVLAQRKLADTNVELGRTYVADYVSFIHYIEALHNANEQTAGHMHETERADLLRSEKPETRN